MVSILISLQKLVGSLLNELNFNILETLFKKRFYLFLEKEEGRERNMEMREKHRPVASGMCPDQGPNPQSRHVPWLGIKLVTFHFVGWCPTNWVTPVRLGTSYSHWFSTTDCTSQSLGNFFISFFFKDFIYLFLERGKGREKERERNINVREIHRLVASRAPPTEDLACNPAMWPDWESNWKPFGS